MTGIDMLAHRIAELEDPIGTIPFHTVGRAVRPAARRLVPPPPPASDWVSCPPRPFAPWRRRAWRLDLIACISRTITPVTPIRGMRVAWTDPRGRVIIGRFDRGVHRLPSERHRLEQLRPGAAKEVPSGRGLLHVLAAAEAAGRLIPGLGTPWRLPGHPGLRRAVCDAQTPHTACRTGAEHPV